LEERGFTLYEDAPGMWIDLTNMDDQLKTPPDFHFETVRDETGLNHFVNGLVSAFEMPEWAANSWREASLAYGLDHLPYTLYVGYLGDQPVATNVLFNGGGVASVYAVGVAPKARGKGIGRAITVLPLLEARKHGAHIGVLFSTEEGYPVYQKIGFAEFCRVKRYLWRA
jgi:GNAT superfamily N-acetyltransferase